MDCSCVDAGGEQRHCIKYTWVLYNNTEIYTVLNADACAVCDAIVWAIETYEKWTPPRCSRSLTTIQYLFDCVIGVVCVCFCTYLLRCHWLIWHNVQHMAIWPKQTRIEVNKNRQCTLDIETLYTHLIQSMWQLLHNGGCDKNLLAIQRAWCADVGTFSVSRSCEHTQTAMKWKWVLRVKRAQWHRRQVFNYLFRRHSPII